MLIKNSPYHPFNEYNQKKVEPGVKKNIEVSNSFSFVKWLKGVVNPLQNLPLISGIYSSINSDNKESDRDMVQNSLGGFLYGGPFGALAGFGNWIFNKIFDKTPSEMVLNITGISKIWKSNKSDKSKLQIGKSESKVIDLSETKSENFLKDSLSKKASVTKNTLHIKENNEKILEFDYPKWEPRKEILKEPHTPNLSNLNKMYFNNNKSNPQNTINKIA